MIADVVGKPPREAAETIGGYWAQIESATAERRVLVSYIQARLKGDDMARYDIQTRTVPGRTLVAITRHVHANEAGPFFSDAFARLRAAGPGIEGVAGCPFVVYYGEVSDDSDGPVELCRPVAARPGRSRPRRSRPRGTDRALPRGGVHPGRDEGHGLAGAGAGRRRA